MSKRVADVIIETLQSAGVRRCYGIVGDTLNEIAHAIDKSTIEWVHMRHEEAGAFAAQAEASLTGNLTALAGSCGPGSLHFINGVFEANRNRAPVILLATQVIRSELGFDFIQEVDFKQVYKNCSVFCEMIYTADSALRMTVAACQAAISKRGVAVLIVPVDVAMSKFDDPMPYSVQVSRPETRPSAEELGLIAKALNSGTKIAIYGGSGCEFAHDEVIAVAERLRAPVAHTSRAKSFLEPNNPHNIGMTGLLGNEAGYHAILECDTLLLLGADFAWRQFYPSHATIIQIDIDPTHLGRRHPVTHGFVGDIKSTLSALLPLLEQHDDHQFHDAFVKRHDDAIQGMRSKARASKHDSISGQHLTELLDRQAAEDALFIADDGTCGVWLFRYITMNGKRRAFASLLHGTMASGMPGALGLQKCSPGRQVIAMCGDGGIAMLLGDLITTIQEDIPIKILVYNNSVLGFVDLEQKSQGMIPLYTDLKNPDFGRVAEAIGLWGRTVNEASELESAMEAWLAQPGPALLNVRVDSMELVMPPFTELGAVYGMALYSTRAVLHGKGGDVWELVKENFL